MFESRIATAPLPALEPLSAAFPAPRGRPRPPFERIALALQGGGALGAYQAGVYQALAEADLHPDWVAGISIGAINAAIIAGNPPESRVDRLREFWERVSAPRMPGLGHSVLVPDGTGARDEPPAVGPFPGGDLARSLFNQWSATSVACLGAAGFFTPRTVLALALPRRLDGGHQLLRHAAARADARALGGFRSHQRRADAPQCRRRQRADGRLRLLRHDDAPHRTSPHPGERRLAARLSGRRDRRPALLGWRPGLEHAARLDGGCRAAEGHAGLPSRSVAGRRTVPAQHGARGDAPEGDPVLQPHPRRVEPLQGPAALQEPGGPAAGQAAARSGREPGGSAPAPPLRAQGREPDPADLPLQGLRGRFQGLRVLAPQHRGALARGLPRHRAHPPPSRGAANAPPPPTACSSSMSPGMAANSRRRPPDTTIKERLSCASRTKLPS